MYRLPNQFNDRARDEGVAAAGGGSTSTTCSCCVVTLVGASVVSGFLLAGLAESPGADGVQPVPPAESMPVSTPAEQGDVVAQAADAESSAPPDVKPFGKGALFTMGLLAFVAAIIAGIVVRVVAWPLAFIVGPGVFIGIYCLAYERMGRSVGKGALIAILMLLAFATVSAMEVAVWLGAM